MNHLVFIIFKGIGLTLLQPCNKIKLKQLPIRMQSTVVRKFATQSEFHRRRQ